MIPTLLEIPLPFSVFGLSHIPIHSFGLCMVLTFVAAWRYLVLELAARRESPDLAEELVTWAAVGGIVGARVLYLISFPQALLSDPLGTIFSGSGFVYYGGFLGGAFAVIWLLKRRAKSPAEYGDIIAPALALGYAIGRVGCQLSGDGDYGKQSDLFWALSYRLGVVPTPNGVLVHPAPVYETILSLALCFFLTSKFVANWKTRHGQIFGLYLIGAALFRFLIEYIRIEPKVFLMFTQAQLTAIALAAFGLYLVYPREAKNN